MEFLKTSSDKEITRLVKEHFIDDTDLIEVGICPVCFDSRNDHVLYQNIGYRLFFENEEYECFLFYHLDRIEKIFIYPKKHFSDLMELDNSEFIDFFLFVQEMMNLLSEEYEFESFDLHSLVKDKNNHFCIELVPHYNKIKDKKDSTKQLKKVL